MPLTFEPPADPLTPSGQAQSHVIESDALQRLTKEIERYGRRELAGRSMLIAGHRGVGKTTLVRKAIENARKRSDYQGRPIFVDLHGPDLLAPPDKDAATKAAPARASGDSDDHKPENPASGKAGNQDKPAVADGNKAKQATEATSQPTENSGEKPGSPAGDSLQPSGEDLQSFVERLTFSLYRAAAKEFVDCFRALTQSRQDESRQADLRVYGLRAPKPLASKLRAFVSGTAKSRATELRVAESRAAELRRTIWDRPDELVEQFALELDGSTDLARIRLLYERAGALKEGVLDITAISGRHLTGSQELALLAASSQAYRIISGKLDEDQTKESSGTNTSNWNLAIDNLLSPLTGVLTGSLAWAALPDSVGPLGKMISSFSAGLASAIAVKFTRTVQRESKQSSKVTFVPERSKLALRRLLPVLVDRFCDMGIPPIFVVDELDKVEKIGERMDKLMGFLKQFVTERAFFCFLADREYYERLEATVSTAAFPKEATLFGDRLFVQYTPEAAHEYLKNVTKVGSSRGSENQDDLTRDLQVLPYVLLRRSYMHPFDLRREISRSTNAENEFRFPPRALFNVPQYRNEVYYQVAVECVLAEERLRDFAEDPNRAQLLYDTLYFPIRTKKAAAEFDASQSSLKDHLTERMGKQKGKPLSDEEFEILRSALSDEDLAILHSALSEQLVPFLCKPRTLLDAIKTLAVATYLPEPKIFPPSVVAIIEAAAGPKLTISAPTAQGDAPKPDSPNPEGSGPSPPPPTGGAGLAASLPTGQAAGTATTQGSPLLLEVTPGGQKYQWQFDKYGYPVKRPSVGKPMAQMKGVAVGMSAATGTLSAASDFINLLDDFEAAVKLLGTKQGTTIDLELWERMRLIPTPPTWSYLKEAGEALRNAPSLPETKKEEYVNALITYRSNLQSSLQTILLALVIARSMTANKQRATELSERTALEVLSEALVEATSREFVLKQIAKIAGDVGSTYPLPPDAFQKAASYQVMLSAIETAAKATEIRKFSPAEVNPQVGIFYENWFIQFYEGRRPTIDTVWPLLAWGMGSLPLGIIRVNPLRMTLREWSQGYVENQSQRQEILRLERLGFRRQADMKLKEILDWRNDPLLRAIEASIRNRGYEKASAILWVAKQSLSQDWLPSENIGCRIMQMAPRPEDETTYRFIEVEGPVAPEGPEVDALRNSKTVRGAFFGSVSALVNTYIPFPYIPNPQSLDDLVARLENLTTQPPS
jgi:hypothetical protein